ncbi:MAG: AAA family ATPase [Phycisphaerales bacterium]|nr:AAA family ATPase [Phycisphaerales bacterium]
MAAAPAEIEESVSPLGEELGVLIRARYPVIYIVSWEEPRVERHLRQIAEARGKQLYVWSVTSGMRRAGAAPAGRPKGLSDPIEALDQVMEHKEPAIYLLNDFHAFLRPVQCNIATIRKLREAARALSDSYKTVVICSPMLELAPELEKDVTVLDYPLPDAREVDGLLRHICAEVAEHSSVEINLGEADREALIRAASGLTLQEAENVFAKTLVNDGRLSADDVSTVFAEKQQIVRKSGLLEYYEPNTALGDVGGLAQLKEWLRRRSQAFTEGARQYGLPAPKGVLLVGVQGCGKSLCAKAVSREWNMPLLRFDVGRVFSSLVGSSEENVRRAIAVAESIAPAVLWVDEIDKAFAGTSGSAGSDGGTSARVMSTFLTWLSEKSKPVFVLATANDITQLPPELLRKGRLDEIFFVDLPDPADRREIFRIHIAKRDRDPAAFDLEGLAAAADGFSGAEIEQAVISALYDAFYLGREVESGDLVASIAETVPLSRTMSEGISGLRGWAEGRARPASSAATMASVAPRRKIEV